MERKKRANGFGMCDRPTVAQDISDRAADIDALGFLEDALSKLQDVGVKPDLTFERRNDSTGISLLHFAGEMCLGHPRTAEAELIG